MFIKGMQEHPDEPRFWMTGACCKHYAGNSVEHSTETGITYEFFPSDLIVFEPSEPLI